MPARGYEGDATDLALQERIRRLELVVARNKPAAGIDYNDDGGDFGGGTLTIADILALIGAGSAPGSFLRTVLGGVGNVQALGTLGATETIDLANANLFWGTLDQDCTISTTGWTNLKDCQITVILFEDGTGGWTPTFSGVTWDGGTPVHDTTAGTFTRYVFTSIDGGTTIIGAKTGGGGSPLTVEDEGTPLATAATTLDFVGAGVTASGTGAEKTITVDVENAGHYELLMAAGSSPLSPLEDGTGTDWLYVWVP